MVARNLLDTNVWLALAFERHAHHRIAREWVEAREQPAAACFCRMTEMSFLRLATSARIFREDALGNAEAVRAYRGMRSDFRIGWIGEAPGIEECWFDLAGKKQPSPKVWMDAYLAAVAAAADARLVTFDRDFEAFGRRGPEVEILGRG